MRRKNNALTYSPLVALEEVPAVFRTPSKELPFVVRTPPKELQPKKSSPAPVTVFAKVVDAPKIDPEMLKWKQGVALGDLVGQELEVVVHKIDTEKLEAWLVLAKKKNQCNDVMREINSVSSSLEKPSKVKVGDLYVAPFLQKIFARGMVRSLEATKAVVHFIDYGEETEVEVAALRQPTSGMLTVPAFAFPVKFKDAAEINLLVKNQIFKVNLLDKNPIPLVQIAAAIGPQTVVDVMIRSKVTAFDASVASILDTKWFILKVRMPEKFSEGESLFF